MWATCLFLWNIEQSHLWTRNPRIILLVLSWATQQTSLRPKVFTKYMPEPTIPLRQWGFRQCLTFSWTTLRGKHCWYPIAVMGVVDTFEHGLRRHITILLKCQKTILLNLKTTGHMDIQIWNYLYSFFTFSKISVMSKLTVTLGFIF